MKKISVNWMAVAIIMMIFALSMGIELVKTHQVMPKGTVETAATWVPEERMADELAPRLVEDVTLLLEEGRPLTAAVVGNYNCYELPDANSHVVWYLSEGLIIKLTGIDEGDWQFVLAGGGDWIKCWVRGIRFTTDNIDFAIDD
jgi:hypothetical protein